MHPLVGEDLVDPGHGDLVAEEAAGVGREGPQHDGDGALVHGADALGLHEVAEDVTHAVVLAVGRWKKEKGI